MAGSFRWLTLCGLLMTLLAVAPGNRACAQPKKMTKKLCPGWLPWSTT